jgi:hypothetical protein
MIRSFGGFAVAFTRINLPVSWIYRRSSSRPIRSDVESRNFDRRHSTSSRLNQGTLKDDPGPERTRSSDFFARGSESLNQRYQTRSPYRPFKGILDSSFALSTSMDIQKGVRYRVMKRGLFVQPVKTFNDARQLCGGQAEGQQRHLKLGAKRH